MVGSKYLKPILSIVLCGVATAIWLPQWIRFAEPPDVVLEPEQNTIQQLAALGYLPFVDIGEGEPLLGGITLHEEDRASDGVNVVFPEFGCEEIEFQDMSGRTLHRIDVSRYPKHECFSLKATADGFIFLAAPNLFKLDDHGELQWEMVDDRAYHHDFDEFEGTTVALTQKWGSVEVDGKRHRVKRNPMVVIDEDGVPIMEVSLLELFWQDVLEVGRTREIDVLGPLAVEAIGLDYAGDLLHANSVQILRRDSVIGKKGNVLISLRSIDTIAVVDLDAPRVVWRWGPGILDHQHHPTLLENGNLLIFDNGFNRGHSRVIELDPASESIVWEYRSTEPNFYTKRRGAAYRLPNDNVLVTESDNGRVFEVTRQGKTVWEYYMGTAENEMKRHTVFRVQRMSRAEFDRRFAEEIGANAHAEAEGHLEPEAG